MSASTEPLTATYYRRPAFRDGVRATVEAERALFAYGSISFDAEFSPAAGALVAALCERLAAGLDADAIPELFGDFAPHAHELLRSFDRYGYLREAALAVPDALDGALFAQQVTAFAERARGRAGSAFHAALVGGAVGARELIAYVTEYYHVVAAAPAIIGASLAHAHDPRRRAILERFLRAELGHDRMLRRALLAADAAGIDDALPLPETFALVSMLHVLAAQEPLGFAACLFLFEEESAAFHRAFAAAARAAGLPEGFVAPVLEHAHVNDAGDHGSITTELLSCSGPVSAEERIVALKHVAILVESLAALERALLAPLG
ncbi:MAG: hypothetical protein QOI11_1042 [Candidatus Eremiobacteraeota bacterium]|jgi:hypothetical protein|nr:hypothetical protein [Candidatus Eremiobacteraeota bacterium]